MGSYATTSSCRKQGSESHHVVVAATLKDLPFGTGVDDDVVLVPSAALADGPRLVQIAVDGASKR